MSKLKWSADEDFILVQHVSAYLGHNPTIASEDLPPSVWREASEKLGSRRTVKQCRERWRNQIDPRLSEEPWTPEEDALLERLRGVHGNAWRLLADMMPGRSENAIKNRHYSAVRRAQRLTKRAAPGSDDADGERDSPLNSARSSMSTSRRSRGNTAGGDSEGEGEGGYGEEEGSSSSSSRRAPQQPRRALGLSEGAAAGVRQQQQQQQQQQQRAPTPAAVVQQAGAPYPYHPRGAAAAPRGAAAPHSSSSLISADGLILSSSGGGAGAVSSHDAEYFKSTTTQLGKRYMNDSAALHDALMKVQQLQAQQGRSSGSSAWKRARLESASQQQQQMALSSSSNGEEYGHNPYATSSASDEDGYYYAAEEGDNSRSRTSSFGGAAASSSSSSSSSLHFTSPHLGAAPGAAPTSSSKQQSSNYNPAKSSLKERNLAQYQQLYQRLQQREGTASASSAAVGTSPSASTSSPLLSRLSSEQQQHPENDVVSALLSVTGQADSPSVAGGCGPRVQAQQQHAHLSLLHAPRSTHEFVLPLQYGSPIESTSGAGIISSPSPIGLGVTSSMHRSSVLPGGGQWHHHHQQAAALHYGGGSSMGQHVPSSFSDPHSAGFGALLSSSSSGSATAESRAPLSRFSVTGGAIQQQQLQMLATGAGGLLRGLSAQHAQQSQLQQSDSSNVFSPVPAVSNNSSSTDILSASPVSSSGSGGATSMAGAAADAALLATYESALAQARTCAESFFAVSGFDPAASASYEQQWTVIAQHVNSLAAVIAQRQIVTFMHDASGGVNVLPGAAYPHTHMEQTQQPQGAVEDDDAATMSVPPATETVSSESPNVSPKSATTAAADPAAAVTSDDDVCARTHPLSTSILGGARGPLSSAPKGGSVGDEEGASALDDDRGTPVTTNVNAKCGNISGGIDVSLLKASGGLIVPLASPSSLTSDGFAVAGVQLPILRYASSSSSSGGVSGGSGGGSGAASLLFLGAGGSMNVNDEAGPTSSSSSSGGIGCSSETRRSSGTSSSSCSSVTDDTSVLAPLLGGRSSGADSSSSCSSDSMPLSASSTCGYAAGDRLYSLDCGLGDRGRGHSEREHQQRSEALVASITSAMTVVEA